MKLGTFHPPAADDRNITVRQRTPDTFGTGIQGCPDQPLDLPDYIRNLTLFILAFRNRHRVALRILRNQPFLVAVGGMLHQLEGEGEDSPGASVVLFQQALGAAKKMLFEVLHVCQVCPPEAVDGLVIVTNHTEVVPGQLLDELELGIVGVLELIDQDMGEP
jgi:hypothetical protein